jgi:propanol-preferring alcohol dehydrogenase
MKGMILEKITRVDEKSTPLTMIEIPVGIPKPDEVLLKVSACGVCHTELDEIEGRTPPSRLPMILGHQIVGRVADCGSKSKKYHIGDRVGVAWIFSACGICKFCREGNENLCEDFKATGRDAQGGYAEFMTVNENFAYPIPEVFSDAEAAPLLCAGAIGYRSLRLTGLQDGQNLGLMGFGASAHLVLTMVKYLYPNSDIYVFTRSNGEREFAKELGASWTGDITEVSPQQLDGIIDTTPVWKPVVEALKNLYPAGRLVINAIRKEDVDKDYLLNIDYPTHLWMEKEIKSVANVTRRDVSEFLELAAKIPLKPEYQEYDLKDANQALIELKTRKIRGAKVLHIGR